MSSEVLAGAQTMPVGLPGGLGSQPRQGSRPFPNYIDLPTRYRKFKLCSCAVQPVAAALSLSSPCLAKRARTCDSGSI